MTYTMRITILYENDENTCEPLDQT